MSIINRREIRHRHRVACAALGIEEELPRRGKFDALLRFAHKYDVNLDWLVCGEGHGIRRHLSKGASGTVAILPCRGPVQRMWA
jgi:hypothetical protein